MPQPPETPGRFRPPRISRRRSWGKGRRTCWVTTHRRYGRAQAEAAVRAVLVVVLNVAAQDVNKVRAADEHRWSRHSRRTVPTQRFGDGVGVGRPNRRADDLDTSRAPDIVERPGELGVPVADQEPEHGGTVTQVQEEIAGLLGHPRAARVGRDTGQVHPSAVEFDHEQHI
jgi:hypothetical protein